RFELGFGMEQRSRAGPRLGANAPRRDDVPVVVANAEDPGIGRAIGAALDADVDAEPRTALDRARHVPDDDAPRVALRRVVFASGAHVAAHDVSINGRSLGDDEIVGSIDARSVDGV